jgi:hypothetical protein
MLFCSVNNHSVLGPGISGASWTEATECGDVLLLSRESQTESFMAVQPHPEISWKLPKIH